MQVSDASEHSSDDDNKGVRSPSSFDYRVSLFNIEVCASNGLSSLVLCTVDDS